MVKTDLEIVWNEFIVKIEDGFDCGRKLPECLHQSAVDAISRKLKAWNQEIDILTNKTSHSLDVNSPYLFQVQDDVNNILIVTPKLSAELEPPEEAVNHVTTNSSKPTDVDDKGLVASIPDMVDSPLDSVHTDINLFLENDEDTDCYASEGEFVPNIPDVTVTMPVVKLELEHKKTLEIRTEDLEAEDASVNTSTPPKAKTTRSSADKSPKKRGRPPKKNTKSVKNETGTVIEENASGKDAKLQDIPKDLDSNHSQDELKSKSLKSKKSPNKRKQKTKNPEPKKPRVVKPSVSKVKNPGPKKRRVKPSIPKVKNPVGRPIKVGGECPAERKYFCDKCPAGYTTQQNLRRHIAIHEKGPLTCEICGNVYHSLPGYSTHMKTHDKNALTCPFCDMKFGSKTWQQRHIRLVHTKEKPYLCDFCGDAFSTNNILSRHRLSHTRIKAFFCELCDFSTHTMDCYKTHIRNKHTDVEGFVCNICGNKYRYKNSYVDHMKRHKAEKPFKCSKCDYRATNKNSLQKHEKRHSDPQYTCDICSKKFATRDHVKRHRVIHTGEKAHKCGLCDYACNVKNNLRKHWKNVHNHTPPSLMKKVHVISGQNPSEEQNIGPAVDNICEETAVASKIISEETVEMTIPADHYLVTHTTVDSVQNATVIGGLTTTVDTSQVDLQFDQSNYHERSVGFDCL